MCPTTHVLEICNFGLIGALPLIFFKRGKLTGMWAVTAAPFFLSFLSNVAGGLGLVPTLLDMSPAGAAILSGAAVPAFAGSMTLIGLTLGAHRIPLALWHQLDDAPVHIVTWGPYASVRHPFYVSFILALIGSFLSSPNIGAIGALLYGVTMMNITAVREERRLLQSDLGAEYGEYLARTGRFAPRWPAPKSIAP